MQHTLSLFKNGILIAFLTILSFISEGQTATPTTLSPETLKNGNLVYPPSYAFVELLKRSSYLSKPETEHYLQKNTALVFHTMCPYYTVQRNGSSCSLATATILLNTVRDFQASQHVEKPATQNEVLEMINNPLWDSATADDGPGVDLEQFGQLLKEMFASYHIEGVTVETIHVEDKSSKTKDSIHHDLVNMSRDDETITLLALNFDYQTFTHVNIDVGHISPVGGYDPLTHLVLILDVDREWTGPYWITEETLLNGINTLDTSPNPTKSPYRGYIRLKVNKRHHLVQTQGTLAP